MSAGTEAVVHYDVTRVALIEALTAIPIGAYLTLAARSGWADAILARLPEASPAAFYMEGVKAERGRIRQEIDPAQLDKLADWFDTDDDFKVAMFPETWPQRGNEVQADLRRWAKVLRGEQP